MEYQEALKLVLKCDPLLRKWSEHSRLYTVTGEDMPLTKDDIQVLDGFGLAVNSIDDYEIRRIRKDAQMSISDWNFLMTIRPRPAKTKRLHNS